MRLYKSVMMQMFVNIAVDNQLCKLISTFDDLIFSKNVLNKYFGTNTVSICGCLESSWNILTVYMMLVVGVWRVHGTFSQCI